MARGIAFRSVTFESSQSHWHGLFLEGGFDRQGRFVHLPTVELARMSACFPQRVIALFLQRKLLNERLAKSMVQWTHSGFSVNASVHISRAAAGRSPLREPQRVPPRSARRSPSTSLGRQQPRRGCERHGHRRLPRPVQRLLPHRLKDLSAHRVPCRGSPAPARGTKPTHSRLRLVLLSGSGHVVSHPVPPEPRSRGLETRPSSSAYPAHRSAR